MPDFAKTVLDRISDLNLNINQAEAVYGFSQGYIRGVVREDDKRAVPSIDKAAKICEALGLEFYIGPPRSDDPALVAPQARKAPIYLPKDRPALIAPVANVSASPFKARQVGFSESDVAPLRGAPGKREDAAAIARIFGGGRPGIDVWTIKSRALQNMGYLPGDRILVDSHAAGACKAGDVVIAQRYLSDLDAAITLLRRYEPPVLVAASPDPADNGIEMVNGSSVRIYGKVIASWRK